MARSWLLGGVILIGALLVLAAAGPQVGTGPAGEDRVTLTVQDGDTELAEFQARIAETPAERFTGLSDTAALGPGEGMGFVYDRTAERTFVMREMAFGIDIVFVDANGTITAIHHADPEDEREFTGEGRWVLEVNEGATTDHGIEVGDRVRGLPR